MKDNNLKKNSFKKNNRYIASLILLLVTIGFLLALPFDGTFVGGLLTALFGASMIGGFADWFGVSALTRKPLGIPFKTQILPKSREKLTESLIYMVERELLTKEAILEKLKHFSISKSIIAYLDNQGGKEDLSRLAEKISEDMLGCLDFEEAGEYLGRLLKDNTADIRLVPLVSGAVEWLSANIADEKLMSRTVEEIKDLILFPRFGLFVRNVIEDIYRSLSANAEKESAGKRVFFKFVLAMADFSDVSPARLSSRLLAEALEYFNQLKDPLSMQRKGLENWLQRISEELLANEALKGNIEQKGRDMLERSKIGALLAEYVYPLVMENNHGGKSASYVESLINNIVEGFKSNLKQQVAVDRYVKSALTRLIDENHDVIGRLVRQKLDSFSTETLVEMFEERAGNDLQIIRINGSIVGGLAGMILYLLTFWI